jgi:ATP-binding protein involved in chromosome partitioning
MSDVRGKIEKTLEGVIPPESLGDVSADGQQVVFSIRVDPSQGRALEPMRRKAEDIVRAALPGMTVTAILTAERKAPPAPSSPTARPQGGTFGGHKISSRPVAPHVRHMIAVASGKGGVGKSTVAANLAMAFSRMGKKTGLLDADIYGSSQPRMMGLRQKPETNDDDMIIPPVAHGIKVMSMGFFVEEGAPVIWRGPMVHSAIQQLFRDVDWGDLDVLVIDLPPGTGDAQLSLAQNVPLSGAVIVSTPQEVALTEAKKGIVMFEKTGVPVLGIVENMSFHECTACGHRDHVFDHGRVRVAAEKLGIDFLGEIPLLAQIRADADDGLPVVASHPSSIAADIFRNIAARVYTQLPEKQKRRV